MQLKGLICRWDTSGGLTFNEVKRIRRSGCMARILGFGDDADVSPDPGSAIDDLGGGFD